MLQEFLAPLVQRYNLKTHMHTYVHTEKETQTTGTQTDANESITYSNKRIVARDEDSHLTVNAALLHNPDVTKKEISTGGIC